MPCRAVPNLIESKYPCHTHIHLPVSQPQPTNSVAHTTAGYLLYAAMTHKTVFDMQEGDVYACVADCGWITGHSCKSDWVE